MVGGRGWSSITSEMAERAGGGKTCGRGGKKKNKEELEKK